jgi:ABC-2 type transport system ATP-binding protein
VGEYAIRTEYLSREFAGVRAVDGMSFEVPMGSVFGFLGPNGAGKTTTIRLLLGLLEPTTGNAEVLGYDVRSDSAIIRERTGALLEHDGLYERLGAIDNLEYFGHIWNIPRDVLKPRIKELLTQLDLWDARAEAVKEWSRGMRQKLAIARALLHNPSLIFLDEPTNGLDPMAAAALREELLKLAAQEGRTVFITTHNLAEAERLCDRIGIVRGGKLLIAGTLDELRSLGGTHRIVVMGRCFEQAFDTLHRRPGIESITAEPTRLIIELTPGVPTAPLVTLLVHAGAEIEEVGRYKPSLEEVFLNLMNSPEEEVM